MNSLPSSYFGSCLREIAAGSSGLENRVDLEKYKVGRGRLMVSQYPPLPFFDFSCNIPSPLTFWEAGGDWAFRHIFKISYDGGFGGWKK